MGATIDSLEVWAEGVEGDFELEIQSIEAGPASSGAIVTEADHHINNHAVHKNLQQRSQTDSEVERTEGSQGVLEHLGGVLEDFQQRSQTHSEVERTEGSGGVLEHLGSVVQHGLQQLGRYSHGMEYMRNEKAHTMD